VQKAIKFISFSPTLTSCSAL